MGALIMTKGTKRLIAHYNDEFGSWIDFYRIPANLARFQRGGANISIWDDIVLMITDPSTTNDHTERADHLTLLPKNHRKHTNLHARWKYFLKTLLSQPNQNKLADYIHQALTAPNVYIVFDVRVAATQDVTIASGNDDGSPYAMITIVTTGRMPITAVVAGGDPPDLDA